MSNNTQFGIVHDKLNLMQSNINSLATKRYPNMSQILDTAISNPQQGQAPVYQAANGLWTNTSVLTSTSNFPMVTLTATSIDLNGDSINLTSTASPPNNINFNSTNLFTDAGDTGVYDYWLPFNLTNYKTGSSYTLATPNTWELVAFNTMNLPINIFATAGANYRNWKMDFAINQTNMTAQNDKDFAMYIEILDSNSTVFHGKLFNSLTPFTIWKNASGYNAVSPTKSENYILTDYIDFTNAVGGASTINLHRYGVASMSCDFTWVLTLSPTNLV